MKIPLHVLSCFCSLSHQFLYYNIIIFIRALLCGTPQLSCLILWNVLTYSPKISPLCLKSYISTVSITLYPSYFPSLISMLVYVPTRQHSSTLCLQFIGFSMQHFAHKPNIVGNTRKSNDFENKIWHLINWKTFVTLTFLHQRWNKLKVSKSVLHIICSLKDHIPVFQPAL